MHQGPAWSGGLLLRLPTCSLAHRTDGLGRGGRWGSELPGLSGTQPAFMPENSSSCSPDAMESVEKMVQGGYGERRCGAVLARRLASFK